MGLGLIVITIENLATYLEIRKRSADDVMTLQIQTISLDLKRLMKR